MIFEKLMKGYADDVGVDIILQNDIILKPGITCVDLGIKVTIKSGTMGIVISRTSAAIKGIYVANCPIDPNYTDSINAIVYNISNKEICYSAGQSFCQLVIVKTAKYTGNIPIKIKKSGKRQSKKFGSTGI